jgi:hypothetical protein
MQKGGGCCENSGEYNELKAACFKKGDERFEARKRDW